MSEDHIAHIVYVATSYMIVSPQSARAPCTRELESRRSPPTTDQRVRWIEDRAFDHLFGNAIGDVVKSDTNDARASRVVVEEVRRIRFVSSHRLVN